MALSDGEILGDDHPLDSLRVFPLWFNVGPVETTVLATALSRPYTTGDMTV